MQPLKLNTLEKWACSKGFNTHLWGFYGDRWENIHFESKHRQVTPQIDQLVKNEPCSEGFNTYLIGFSGR